MSTTKVQISVNYYADTPRGDKNKLFSWRVNGLSGAHTHLKKRLKQDFIIRAAYYVRKQGNTVLQNQKINL